jgi:predicted dehydrogenase
MEVWSEEANACIDFARRHLSVVQRNESGQGSPLAVREVELAAQDQLTCELRDFVTCVREGKEPRVPGEAGLRALRVAERLLNRRDQRRLPRAA